MKGRIPAHVICCLALFAISGLAHADVQYVYDANHRLVGAIGATGNTTRYVYDDLGNLVRADSLASTQPALLGFTPEHGAPGVPVSIYGQGFSTTAANNAVKFNGTAAVVASANLNQLQVSVPAVATTGTISVTVAGQTVTSETPFVVDGTGLAPVVTGVTPVLGKAGTSVSLAGSHLDPVPGATAVTLNGAPLPTVTATDSTLTVVTPAMLGAGRFLVTTPYGQATAPADFVPVNSPESNIYPAFSRQLTIGAAPVTVAFPASSIGELYFNAAPGSWVSLETSGWTSGNLVGILYDPRGTRLQSVSVGSNGPAAELPVLVQGGNYILEFESNGAVSPQFALEQGPTLSVGTPANIVLNSQNSERRLIFNPAPGVNYGFGFSGLSTNEVGAELTMKVLDSNGQVLAQTGCIAGGTPNTCDLNVASFIHQNFGVSGASLPSAGPLQLVVGLSGATAGQATVLVSPDVVATPAPGTASSVVLSQLGQNGEIRFSTGASPYWTAVIANPSTSPAHQDIALDIYDGDGRNFYSGSAESAQTLNFPVLTPSTDYVVYLDPYRGSTASVQVTLLPDTVTAATVGGSAAAASSTVPNQNSYVTFQSISGHAYTVTPVCTSATSLVNVNMTDAGGNSIGSSGYCSSASSVAASTGVLSGNEVVTVRLNSAAAFQANVSVVQQ
jgi:YD repeat-containing protein